MIATLKEWAALWFRLPAPPQRLPVAASVRGASRDRTLPGKRRRAARRGGPMNHPRTLNAWNVGARSALRVARSLRFLLRQHPADVTGLLEAGRATPLLRLRFGRRHRVIRRRSDVTALVPRSLPRPSVSVLRHDVAWTGPKAGIRHRGRRHLVLDWPQLRVVIVHGVPGGPTGGIATRGFNRPAWAADRALIETAVRGDKPTIVIGDQNATTDELAPTWTALGMRQVATGAKVDHGAARGVNVTGRRLGRFGSDHPATRYRIGR